MTVKLKALHGVHAGMEFAVPLPLCLIGRAQDCYVRAKSQYLDWYHSALYVKDNKVFVQDLGSRTGTFVNGQRVQHDCELKHGDELRAGPLALEVHLEPTPEGEKKPPVACVKEAAERTRAASESAHRFRDQDIVVWFAEENRPTRQSDTPAAQPMAVGNTERAPLRQAAERQTQDGTEAADDTHHEATKGAAGDTTVKAPGLWSARPTAASTQDAAANALKNILHRR